LAFDVVLSLSSDVSNHYGTTSKFDDLAHYNKHSDDNRCNADSDYDTICDENATDDSGVKFSTYVSHN